MTDRLLRQLDASTCNFLAVKTVKDDLLKAGFVQLDMAAPDWDLRPDGRYFLTRNSSALFAFIMPHSAETLPAFRIIAVQKNVVLAADKLGKIKTTFLDIGLIALTMSTIQTGEIAGKAFYFFDWLGQITYYIGAFFAIVSGVNYVLKNKQVLADKKPVETDLPAKTLSETEKENDVEEVVHND